MTFGELVEFAIGGGWGAEDDGEVPVTVIRGTDFAAARGGDLSDCPRRFETRRRTAKRALRPGDILLEISGGSKASGQTTGRSLLITDAIATDDGRTVIPASFCRLVRLDRRRVLPRYAFYCLQEMYTSGRAGTYENQSTGISNFQFKYFLDQERVRLPGLPAQERIAWALGTLDEMKVCNRSLVETLEEIAATQFKASFVDFVKREDLVESEVGPIPSDWSVGPLTELVAFSGGKRPSAVKKQGSVPVLGANGPMGFCDDVLHEDPVVTIGRVGACGEVHRSRGPSWASDNTIVARPAEGTGFMFAYHLLRAMDFRPLVTGTTQPLLTQRAVKSQLVVIPTVHEREKYEQRVAPLMALGDTLKQQSATLAQMRDALLPKLISGRISVGLESSRAAGAG